MDFSNMTYAQVVSEKARLEAELEAIRREQGRLDEIVKAQRKAVFDRLPRTVGFLSKHHDEFQLRCGYDDGSMEWHVWVSLAQDILEADEVAQPKRAYDEDEEMA